MSRRQILLYKGVQVWMPRESACNFEARKTMPTMPKMVTSFPQTHLCRLHIFELIRNPIAILSCWFDSSNLKFLHGMTFNHWELNLYWNALNLFTSVGSSRKIKSALSIFFGFHFPEPFQFFQVQNTV